MGNKIGPFVVGGLIGAAVALLYAPRSGDETRAIVSDKVNTVWGEAQEKGAQAQANVQQFYHDATTKGQQAYQEATAKGQMVYDSATTRVQETAENIKPVFSEKSDELRGKIEAARQRIASQVAKNAGEARDTAKETIPVAAQAATSAVDSIEAAIENAVDEIKSGKDEKAAIEDAVKAATTKSEKDPLKKDKNADAKAAKNAKDAK